MKKISKYDPSSGKTQTRQYEYTNGVEFMDYADLQDYRLETLYWGSSKQLPASKRTILSSTPFFYAIPTDYSVRYRRVEEYHGTTTSNTGKTIYSYINDIPFPTVFSSNKHTEKIKSQRYSPVWKYWYPPMLNSKVDMKKTAGGYENVYSKYIDYMEKELNRNRGMHIYRFNIWKEGFHYVNRLKEPTYYYANFDVVSLVKRPSTIKEYFYDSTGQSVIKTTEYSYQDHSHFLPTNITETGSNGVISSSIMRYPTNYASEEPYKTMLQQNMVDYVVEEEKQVNNSLDELLRNNYKLFHNSFFSVANIQIKTRSGILITKLNFDYDLRGNISEVVEDDTAYITYLWSYKGEYPIAEIRGVRYSQIIQIIGESYIKSLENKLIPDVFDFEKINNLRTHSSLKDAHITTYTYKPLVGMLSATDPSGLTTYYDYDSFGRLKETYIMDNGKKVIQTYDYNYRNK